jgi:elongator complex protein 2
VTSPTFLLRYIGDSFHEVWDPWGNFVLSVSKDLTTRLFGLNASTSSWHELARPQIHGYDMSCIVCIPGIPFRFASGAEEKVIRIFDAPITVVKSVVSLTKSENLVDSISDDSKEFSRATKAVVPELGLSNKATVVSEEVILSEADILSKPPLEEYLVRNSLFPEIDKLYGHGFELYCLGISHSGSILDSASVAKSSQGSHAAIRLWNTKTWTQLNLLEGHQTTVVQ